MDEIAGTAYGQKRPFEQTRAEIFKPDSNQKYFAASAHRRNRKELIPPTLQNDQYFKFVACDRNLKKNLN